LNFYGKIEIVYKREETPSVTASDALMQIFTLCGGATSLYDGGFGERANVWL